MWNRSRMVPVGRPIFLGAARLPPGGRREDLNDVAQAVIARGAGPCSTRAVSPGRELDRCRPPGRAAPRPHDDPESRTGFLRTPGRSSSLPQHHLIGVAPESSCCAAGHIDAAFRCLRRWGRVTGGLAQSGAQGSSAPIAHLDAINTLIRQTPQGMRKSRSSSSVGPANTCCFGAQDMQYTHWTPDRCAGLGRHFTTYSPARRHRHRRRPDVGRCGCGCWRRCQRPADAAAHRSRATT